MVEDKAGREYWDDTWRETAVPDPVDPHSRGFGSLYVRRLHQLFQTIFSNDSARGRTLVELGCGASIWLPYFAREFGLRVSGIDYSEAGCRQTDRILRQARVDAELACADFFKPPAKFVGAFDYVYSAGVVEHFVPTEDVVRAFAAFLRPGGTMITMVPNMSGAVGWMQRLVNRPVYDIHVPLTAEALKAAHEQAGLQIVRCEYFLSTGFGIVNPPEGGSSKSAGPQRILVRLLGRLSVVVWALEDKLGRLPSSRLLSPHVVCIARKPER